MGENRQTLQSDTVGYEIIEWEGKPARKYPSGLIKDERGHNLFLPPEIARAMQQARKDIARLVAGEAIAEGTNSTTPEEGAKKILSARLEVALHDKGRAGNDAARMLLIAAGYYPQDRKVEVEGHVIHKPALPEFPKEYLEYVRRLAERDTVEGRVIDDDNEGTKD
jgi:hypothetical protein